MSAKIFNQLFCKNLKNPKNFHLYPSHRSVEKAQPFTKNGDGGKSKIYNGELHKDHVIFEAIGVTEELNACIGLAREFVKDDEKLSPLAEKLRKIQLVLVDVIDIVSSLQPKESSVDKTKPPVPPSTAKVTGRDVADLEALITHYGTLLPPVEKNIMPGGGKASAALHVAKSVCRRCERVLVSIFKDMGCEENLLAYVNRLSSYLSQAARISAKFSNRSETIYKPIVKGDGVTADK